MLNSSAFMVTKAQVEIGLQEPVILGWQKRERLCMLTYFKLAFFIMRRQTPLSSKVWEDLQDQVQPSA